MHFVFFFKQYFSEETAPQFLKLEVFLAVPFSSITFAWSPAPGSGRAGRPLSSPSSPQCHAFEVLRLVRPPARPFKAQPIPI